MGQIPESDRFTDEEAERRLEAALRAALKTPPKPKKGDRAKAPAKRKDER